jgi:hypothetical protein
MNTEGREAKERARSLAARTFAEQREIHLREGSRFLRDPAAEASILADWRYAWLYSRDIVRGRWPEFEAAMATTAPVSDPAEIRSIYNYVRYVVGGRLEAAEEHLAADAAASVDYARDVLRHVWRDGMANSDRANASISRHPTASAAYRTEMGMG